MHLLEVYGGKFRTFGTFSRFWSNDFHHCILHYTTGHYRTGNSSSVKCEMNTDMYVRLENWVGPVHVCIHFTFRSTLVKQCKMCDEHRNVWPTLLQLVTSTLTLVTVFMMASIHPFIQSVIHPLVQSVSQSVIHPPSQQVITPQSSIHPSIHPSIQSLTLQSFSQSVSQSVIHPSTHPSIQVGLNVTQAQVQQGSTLPACQHYQHFL